MCALFCGLQNEKKIQELVLLLELALEDLQGLTVKCFAGIYSVELVNDSLYEWHVKIRT